MTAYNTSLNALLRWQHVFDEVIKHPDMVVVVEDGDPRMLAYKLREALHSARKNNVLPYCNLSLDVSQKDTCVEVSFKRSKAANNITIKAEDANTFVEIISVFDAVELMEQTQIPTATFPNFNFAELVSLRNWATNRGYEIVSTSPLTVKKHEQQIP